MKYNKLITLDLEIIDRLRKEKNASGLVNQVLVDYFKKTDNPWAFMNKEEREKYRKELKIKIEAAEKLEALNGKPNRA